MQSRDLSSLVQAATDALETIGKIAGGATVDTALAALNGVVAIVETVRKGFAGEVTPKETLDQLALLGKQLTVDDAAADVALHEKFGS